MERNTYDNIVAFLTDPSKDDYPEEMVGAGKKLAAARQNFRRKCSSFVYDDGRLYYQKKDGRKVRVVLASEKVRILTDLHSGPGGGHAGENRTRKKVAARYYWDTITTDVSNFCQSCDQ